MPDELWQPCKTARARLHRMSTSEEMHHQEMHMKLTVSHKSYYTTHNTWL